MYNYYSNRNAVKQAIISLFYVRHYIKNIHERTSVFIRNFISFPFLPISKRIFLNEVELLYENYLTTGRENVMLKA